MELIEATADDLEQIIVFLRDMVEENGELPWDEAEAREAVGQCINGVQPGVHWFLFYEDAVRRSGGRPFGLCHSQSVHCYWRVTRRYYVGGFYICPECRGRGLFGQTVTQLQAWAQANGGDQLYAHIHRGNEKSREAFGKYGFGLLDDYAIQVKYWG